MFLFYLIHIRMSSFRIVDLLYYGALQLRQIGTEPEVFNNTVEQVVKLITLLANMNTTELEPVKITEVIVNYTI